MTLDTQVNIINDSSQRIKIKIDNDKDRKYDEIINIEPGGRYDGARGSVSGSGNFDVVIDIITNPPGPGNNERHGAFRFNNPWNDSPYVESDDFKWVQYPYKPSGTRGIVRIRPLDSDISSKYIRRNDLLKTNWAKDLTYDLLFNKYDDLNPIRFQNLTGVAKVIEAAYSEAPRPLITIEAFMQDTDAKVWDLRIASDNFVPVFQDT